MHTDLRQKLSIHSIIMLQKCVLHIGWSQRLRDKNTETNQSQNRRKSTEESNNYDAIRFEPMHKRPIFLISPVHDCAVETLSFSFLASVWFSWASAVLYAPWYHTLSVTKLSDRNEINVFTSYYNGFCLYLNKITANEKLAIIENNNTEEKMATTPATTVVAAIENLK